MTGEHERERVALGQAVRLTREERGMSPAELALAAGIARRGLDAIEAGRFDPAYDVLIALAAGLGVELAALVTRANYIADQCARTPPSRGARRVSAFGRRLRELRDERGVSQEALAVRAGLHRTTVFKIEHDVRGPRLGTLLLLARALDVKPGELVEGLDLDDEEGT